MSEKNILNNSTEIMDYNNPLTREEMIAYSTVLVDANNKKLDSIANFYKEQNEILAAAVKDLAASMISIVGEVRNQGTALYEIKNELSGFANSQEEIKSSIDKAAETFKTVSFTIDKRQREAINENNKPINPLFFSTKDARFNSLWIVLLPIMLVINSLSFDTMLFQIDIVYLPRLPRFFLPSTPT